MCGFAGVVVWDDQFRVSAETLKRMSARIAHRGPDGEGIYLSPDRQIAPRQPQVALAHRRLAILDPDPRSNQPFTDEAGRWLVFNGEIYNFRELRAELSRLRPDYVWRTTGDTEVLLVGFAVWGEQVVEHLNGMFAIAIWDEPTSTLFLARDRMGQKPLYVAAIDETGRLSRDDHVGAPMGTLPKRPRAIAFASELSALLAVPWFRADTSAVSLWRYLRWGYMPNPLTIYQGAHQLPIGSFNLVSHVPGERDSLGMSYFKPTRNFGEQTKRVSDAAAVIRTRELVCRAVRRQIVSDVPIGCFLSGGIDSSIVAYAMKLAAGRGQQVSTFSIGFDDPRYDESGYAMEVARCLGTNHHEFRVRPNAALDLPKLAEHYAEPFGDSSALPAYYLSRATRQHVKVALSGDGGDELFGGYDRYRAMHLSNRLRPLTALLPAGKLRPLLRCWEAGHPKSQRTRAARFLNSLSSPAAQRYQEYVRLFPEPLIEALLDGRYADVPLRGNLSVPRKGVPGVLEADRLTYLPDDLLTKVDRASMAFGLEVRSPFMDHELVGFASNLRTDQLLDRHGGKRMLRAAFASDLPASVFNRRKMGFAVPIGDWFRGELKSMLRDTLTATNSFASSNFDMAVVQRLIDEHESANADHSQRLYALLMIELWWNTIRR